MTISPFSIDEVAALSVEIDLQLQELKVQDSSAYKNLEDSKLNLPLKQFQAIERATQEKPESFLKKFFLASQRDLCEEGGVLYAQWKKWGDLSNEVVLEKYGAVLVSLGFTGEVLPILAVSLAVITLHLTTKTICEEYKQ